MYAMFGFLVGRNNAPAVVLGEFGGLYAKDLHPRKTIQRTTDITVRAIIDDGYAGGYMWSLNPESAYQYNPFDTRVTATEGLLSDDWLTPNQVFLRAMAPLNQVRNRKKFPCFEA